MVVKGVEISTQYDDVVSTSVANELSQFKRLALLPSRVEL